jgi:enoyl-CoA hydratase
MKFVHLEIRDQIATVTFDRPPVNALTAQVSRELISVFHGLGETTEASVAILTGAGTQFFCGGIDLNSEPQRFAGEIGEGDSIRDFLDPGLLARDLLEAIYDCSVPVIAAVNGVAVGAGLAMAAACDVLFASSNARFAVAEINAGVLGGGRHVQRLVGPFKARRMYLSGEFESAEELYRLGAVEAVVAPDELMTRATGFAQVIASKSPLAIRLAKESLARVEHLPLNEGYRIEQSYTRQVLRYNDAEEARLAILEKRRPNWTWS